MRPLSFLLALAVLLAVPTLADPQANDLPGVGTFAYNGTTAVVAHRHLAALDLR